MKDAGVKVDPDICVYWEDGDGVEMKGERMVGPVSSNEPYGKVIRVW